MKETASMRTPTRSYHRRSEGVAGDDFVPILGAHPLPDRKADGILDEFDAAIAEEHVDSPFMEAPRGIVTPLVGVADPADAGRIGRVRILAVGFAVQEIGDRRI